MEARPLAQFHMPTPMDELRDMGASDLGPCMLGSRLWGSLEGGGTRPLRQFQMAYELSKLSLRFMPRCDGDELVDSPPVNQFQSDDTLLLLFFMASLERSSSPSAIASCSSLTAVWTLT